MKGIIGLILIIITLGVANSQAVQVDNNTFSNYNDVRLDHYQIIWNVDVDKQQVNAQVNLNFYVKKNTSKVSLDVWNLTFTGAADQCRYSDKEGKTNVPVSCSVMKHSPDYGDELVVSVFDVYQKDLVEDQQFNLTINYTIGNSSIGLQFLKADQTTSKLQPFFYAYSKQIYARSLIPIMDTPIIRSTWEAQIILPVDQLRNVFMSGASVNVETHEDFIYYFFEQRNQVPSYLFAIVGGNLDSKQIGQSFVIAEPDIIDKYDDKLKDIDNYFYYVEQYLNVPYMWDPYHLVIMPPSFPLGGVENPSLSFISADVIYSSNYLPIKEIIHSWVGDIVTVENWQNLWLSEGIATYIARYIEQIYIYDSQKVKIQSWLGNITMMDDFELLKKQNEETFTTLIPNVTAVNPDQGFSTIPSEKGYQFMLIMQKALGASALQEFLHEWIKNNFWMSRDAVEFQAFFSEWVTANFFRPQFVLQQVNFDKWLHQSYLPPNQDSLQQYTAIPYVTEPIHLLADSFVDYAGCALPDGWDQVSNWPSDWKQIFLRYFYERRDKIFKLQNNFKLMLLLDQCYNFSNQDDVHILSKWFQLVIYTKYYQTEAPKINEYLQKQGKVRNILPIYQAYMDSGMKQEAQSLFNEYQSSYHPAAVIAIKKIINQQQNQQYKFEVIN